MELAQETCTPCRTGEGKLTSAEAVVLLGELHDWTLYPDHIVKRLNFKNFVTSLAYVNAIGKLAETVGHHPDITFGWGYAEIRIATHSVGGLTRNDFILAAKIDALSATS